MLRTLGRQGIAELVEHHCRCAARMAQLLAVEPGIRILNEVVLNQVAVSFGDGDAASRKAKTEAVIAEVQKDGTCFAGGAGWHGEWIMRVSVTSAATTMGDIEISARAIIEAWRKVRGRDR
jgi:glutamate/tyrosine decarboxylase-like PLP-dependent enzyme